MKSALRRVPVAVHRALGIDPGLVATGYGVLERAGTGFAVVDVGVLTTTTTQAFEARLRLIYDGVRDVLVKHTPDVVVLEDLYAEYKFPRTALLMAHARGVVCLAAGESGVPVIALAPAEVKRTVAFNGAASKEQVQRSIGRLLSLTEPPHPSHVADALALAWTGLSRAGQATVGRGPERAAEVREPASPTAGRAGDPSERENGEPGTGAGGRRVERAPERAGEGSSGHWSGRGEGSSGHRSGRAKPGSPRLK